MQFDVRDQRRGNWLWIRRELVRQHGDRLGTRGIAVYAALACCADYDEEDATPSVSTIADLVDLSRPTVRKAINDLVRLGWLAYKERTREDGSNTSHQFFLLPCPVENDLGEGGGKSVSTPSQMIYHHKNKERSKQRESSSSGGAGAGAGSPSGDSVPKKPAKPGAAPPFRGDPPDWLPEKDHRFLDAMAECYEQYGQDPEERAADLLQLAKNQWWRSAGGGRQPDIEEHTAIQHAKEHPWEKVVAAYVIARRADVPQDYADAVLDRDFNQPSQSYDGPDNAADDPKQRPAEAKSRIDNAIDDARPVDR
jgi:hypothetical protein